MKPFYSKHGITIYHADSRDILGLIPPVDFIFTDPSYGHNNNNGDLAHNFEKALGRDKKPHKARPIRNDSFQAANDLAQWLFEKAAQKLRCCCCCCCGGGGGPDPQFARWSLMMDQHLEFKQMVVWDKGRMGLGWHYRRSYEVVLVGQKGKGRTAWFDTTCRIENIIRPGDYGIRKIIPSERDHPTPKPPELAAHFIQLHSRRGQLVFDPFMGGGSTLIAAARTGRRAIGVDIEKRWCRLAAQRLDSEFERMDQAERSLTV